MSKPDDDELRALWRSQNEKEPPMSLENVMKQDVKLARRVKWRNATEYVAGGFVVVMFGRAALDPHDLPALSRAGCVAIIVGTVVVLAHLRRRGTPADAPPAEAPTRMHLAHYRDELVRQRDLLADVPRWYLAPMVPGLALFFAGFWLAGLHQGVAVSELARGAIRPLLVVGGIFATIAFGNGRATANLTRKIEALGDE